MTLFKRKRWPKDLERRQKENAAVRKQFDAQFKDRAKARAQYAQEQTEENSQRIAQVEATVRGLTARLKRDN